MDLISDILLIFGALGAAFYCVVLSRRLARFTNLEKGMGGAIAVLSAQVDEMTKSLHAAREQAATTTRSLESLTSRAEEVTNRLELHVASMHDISDEAEPGPTSADEPLPFRRKDNEQAPQTPSPEPKPSGSPGVRSFFSTHRSSTNGAPQ